jgi:alpha-mannosidase
MPKKKPRVYVVLHNHFDPIWRRCWDRDFVYQGRCYRSYAVLEDVIITRWLDMARKDPVTISEGQAAVLRKYIERHPERLAEIRQLVAGGRCEVTGAGETVVDSNIPCGETLVRNYALGILWNEDVLGAKTEVCWLEDAFGQSAQMPQIMRGCELRFATRLSYSVVPGPYWRGLDGSVVCKVDDFPVRGAGTNVKYAPHHPCNGYGCEECYFTGMVPDPGIPADMIENALENLDTGKTGWGIVLVGGEEHLPTPKFANVVQKVARKDQTREYRHGTFADVALELSDPLKALDDPKLKCSEEVEGNPTSSGCLVTRIRTKQETRRAEALLLSAEHLATRVMAVLHETYPQADLDGAWRTLCFTQFHDAVTATHINAAYFELMDMFSDIAEKATRARRPAIEAIERRLRTNQCDGSPVVVFNTTNLQRTDLVETTIVLDAPVREERTARITDSQGKKMSVETASPTFRDDGREVRVSFVAEGVPGCGEAVYYVARGPRVRKALSRGRVIENEFFRVVRRQNTIGGIADRSTGKSVFPNPAFPVNTLFLEDDGGDPWGTIRPPEFRENLATHNLQAYRDDLGDTQRLVIEGRYQGEDPNVIGLAWKQEILLRPGIKRIDFVTMVDWDTRSRRLRVGFPARAKGDRARYGIPYGNLERGPYKPRYWHHNMPNGDWPATHWVDIKTPEGGIALLNRGLLSHRVQDGALFLSLLRSPEDRFCLNEPEFYDCPDYDGALDRGRHRFEYALYPHPGDFRGADVPSAAWGFNHPLISLPTTRHDGEEPTPEGWIQVEGTGVILSAVKKAEKGNKVVLRLFESFGKPTKAVVQTSFPVAQWEEANLLERRRKKLKANHPIPLRPYEIKTLLLTVAES